MKRDSSETKHARTIESKISVGTKLTKLFFLLHLIELLFVVFSVVFAKQSFAFVLKFPRSYSMQDQPRGKGDVIHFLMPVPP